MLCTYPVDLMIQAVHLHRLSCLPTHYRGGCHVPVKYSACHVPVFSFDISAYCLAMLAADQILIEWIQKVELVQKSGRGSFSLAVCFSEIKN